MIEDLTGKVAVVTGAASGIGRVLAGRLAASGARLVLADIEDGPLEEVASALRDGGAEVVAVHADVSKADDVERIGMTAMDVYGALHLCVNNAGVAGGGLAWEVPLDEWDWVLGVNLYGVIHGLRSFVPRIIESGGGHVVNIASMAGLTSNPGMAAYNVTKHSVVTLSETLALDLSLTHPEVGVTVVCPGWVRTQINRSERNRPERPGSALDHDRGAGGGTELQFDLRAIVDGLIESGLEPDDVADMIVEAVRTGRFTVLTHPGWQSMVTRRVEGLLAGEQPRLDLPTN
ncbi:MAG: SDR family NAD(P)-dependent oxidoreductase [Actinomycetes bacterium]